MPTVFLSYAHESSPGPAADAHHQRVVALAHALLAAGWDVRLDRFVGHPPTGWPRWMAAQVDAADRILCICTRTYRRRFEGEQGSNGLGVSWEGYLLTGMLYRDRHRWADVIPVWPADAEVPLDFVPLVLRPLDGVAFDADAIVARLGTVGPPLGAPTLTHGYDFDYSMDPTRLLGALYRPVRGRLGGAGPRDVPPSTFLRPEHAIVPFHGREAELEELDRWCEGGGVRARVMHGVGGAGKTRLALELCARRAREGWRAGPLVSGALTREGAEALVRDPIPLLVCVDYAETRRPEVALLLNQAAEQAAGPMRLLLLARHDGEWVDALARDVPELRDLLDRALRVEGETSDGVAHAARAFAGWFGVPAPEMGAERRATPLEAQVDALLAVRGDPGRGLERLVDHEEKYLVDAARAWGVRDAVGQLMPKAAALATLAQGWPADGLDWLRGVPGMDGELPADLAQALVALASVYLGEDGGVAPVRPDRVGEVLVARRDPEGVLASAACGRGRAVEALTVVTRVAQRSGQEGPLRGLLGRRWRELGIVEMSVAMGDPLGRLAAEVLKGEPDVTWARAVEHQLPWETVALRELAEVVTRVVLDGEADLCDADRARLLGKLGKRLSDLGRLEEAVAATASSLALWRRLAAARPDALVPDLSDCLNSMGIRLLGLGRGQEALTVTEEAVLQARRLASLSIDGFASSLATNLCTLAAVLRHFGRWEESLVANAEAVEIRRSLVKTRPAEFERLLGTGLQGLSISLSKLERRSEALLAATESVAILRRVYVYSSDSVEVNLADALAFLGGMLASMSRPEEALTATVEAQEIARRLAAGRPDVFTVKLSSILIDVGSCLAGLGRHEAALAAASEAVNLLRARREQTPDQAAQMFAQGLLSMGQHLSTLGRGEEAIVALAEGVAVCRSLGAVRPEALTPDLALGLTNLGQGLLALGRRDEAVSVTAEAVVLYRRLANSQPDASELRCAFCLARLGCCLWSTGKHGEALAAATEALALYRKYEYMHCDDVSNNIAYCLDTIGNTLASLGHREAALAAAQDGVVIRSRLAAARPCAFRRVLALSLTNLGVRFAELRRYEEAVGAAEAALAHFHGLASPQSQACEPHIAANQHNMGIWLRELDRGEAALSATMQAVRLRRKLALSKPEFWEHDLQESLIHLGNLLTAAGRKEDALVATDEAVMLCRRLAASDSAAFGPKLASGLVSLAQRMAELGRLDEAVSTTEEAVALFRLMPSPSDACETDFAWSLTTKAMWCLVLGRDQAARSAAEEGVALFRRLATSRLEHIAPRFSFSLLANGLVLSAAGRHVDAAGTFAEGMRVLLPQLRLLPPAFRDLAPMMLQEHSDAAQRAGVEADADLVFEFQEALGLRDRLSIK